MDSREVPAAVKIQSVARRFLSIRHVALLKLAVRIQARRKRGDLDVWSTKCLLLLQRCGRGFLSRARAFRAVQKMLAKASFAKRGSFASVGRSAKMLNHVKQRWLPLGYNPPKTDEDRQARLRAMRQQVRVNAAMKLQAWWRQCVRSLRAHQHQLRMIGLTYLNMRCILIQRWWRSVIRQKKFLLPSEQDVRSAAEAIVSAEELRIKRDQQAVVLKKVWKQDVLHDYTKEKDTAASLKPLKSNASFRSGSVSHSMTLTSNPLSHFSSPGAHSSADQPLRRLQKVTRIYNRSTGLRRSVDTTRFLSSDTVAQLRGVKEWNGSTAAGVPQWYAAPHSTTKCLQTE